jgi:hypothetical protein
MGSGGQKDGAPAGLRMRPKSVQFRSYREVNVNQQTVPTIIVQIPLHEFPNN